MSDSACHVDVRFTIYGRTFKWNAFISYTPNYDGGVDERIEKFFNDSYETAYAEWKARCYEKDAERKAALEEAAERAEYERLRLKYGEWVEK